MAIRKFSAKRSKEMSVYKRVKDQYFKKHPECEFPNCDSINITLHHMRGRTGSLLTDDRYFKSLCLPHHQWVENNPTEAKELGLSADRL